MALQFPYQFKGKTIDVYAKLADRHYDDVNRTLTATFNLYLDRTARLESPLGNVIERQILTLSDYDKLNTEDDRPQCYEAAKEELFPGSEDV